MAEKLILYLSSLISNNVTKSYADQRRKVRRIVAEYRGSDGEDYRKSFESLPDETPEVPQSGTHEKLNSMKIQWK